MSAPTKLPRTEFCIVKRTCEISDVPHLPPFAKLPETLCRKPYFHIYHIIPHIKKIVKALAHKNLDYLYDHFGKRIVKSYKRAGNRIICLFYTNFLSDCLLAMTTKVISLRSSISGSMLIIS